MKIIYSLILLNAFYSLAFWESPVLTRINIATNISLPMVLSVEKNYYNQKQFLKAMIMIFSVIYFIYAFILNEYNYNLLQVMYIIPFKS